MLGEYIIELFCFFIVIRGDFLFLELFSFDDDDLVFDGDSVFGYSIYEVF